MSAHTKGPWVVRARERFSDGSCEGFYKIEGFVRDSNEQEYRVAHVVDANDSPENEANARLIAAAPELLDVLQEIDQGLWQNFISVRKRPTLADITAIWELAQKWRAALSKVHP